MNRQKRINDEIRYQGSLFGAIGYQLKISKALSLLLSSLSQEDNSNPLNAEQFSQSAIRVLRSALPESWEVKDPLDDWHLRWAIAVSPSSPASDADLAALLKEKDRILGLENAD
jgi:hypothetical protein